MSTCCNVHVYMLRRSRLHVAAFMSTCCGVHVYMLQRSCLHVADFMSTCCSVHVYMLPRSVAPGSNPAEFCSAPMYNQSSCVDQRLGAQQRPPSSKCRPSSTLCHFNDGGGAAPVFHGSTALFHPMFYGCITIIILYYLRFKSVRTNNIRVKQKQRKKLP